MRDEKIFTLIKEEQKRQENNIELIASENFVSYDVLEAVGSVLTNKYAEGYPKARYYGGCEYVDCIEQLAIDRAKELFGAEHANVQPHSGSQANMAVYMSVLDYNDTVLGMSLSEGGHLTHGHRLNFSGLSYKFEAYGVNEVSQEIDYDEVLRIALEVKPKLIVAGASAYSKEIDFKRFRAIADEVGAYLMVDMAHIAGLVAAGLHQNPVPYADFVTSTTHKTLRGPRGGLILCKEKYAKAINRTIFPGIQGGPLVHVIAGKAVCFFEALQPSFIDYQKQVIKNCRLMYQTLISEGFKIVANGSDNHMFLIDVKSSVSITGLKAQEVLDEIGITVNKNTIPADSESPMVTSGIRIGTPAITTRGFSEEDVVNIALIISKSLNNIDDKLIQNECHAEVLKITGKYPLYSI